MKVINKIGLFFSSFVPLFFLLIIKEFVEIINQNWSFNFLNSFILIILLLMLFLGICSIIKLLKKIDNSKFQEFKIISKKNITEQHFLGYFSLFVLFAISFEIEKYSMALIFFIVLTFVAVVYIKNDMYFINPFLNMLGYSFYQIEIEDNNQQTLTIYAYFKGIIIEGEIYKISYLYPKLIFIKK